MAIIATGAFPMAVAAVDATPAPVAQRFPVPPLVWEFLKEIPAWSIQTVVNILSAAVTPEATHLEPTHGQIWPR